MGQYPCILLPSQLVWKCSPQDYQLSAIIIQSSSHEILPCSNCILQTLCRIGKFLLPQKPDLNVGNCLALCLGRLLCLISTISWFPTRFVEYSQLKMCFFNYSWPLLLEVSVKKRQVATPILEIFFLCFSNTNITWPIENSQQMLESEYIFFGNQFWEHWITYQQNFLCGQQWEKQNSVSGSSPSLPATQKVWGQCCFCFDCQIQCLTLFPCHLLS